MRARLAVHLVKICGRWWDASYSAYVRHDKGEVPESYMLFWEKWAKRVNKVLWPIAVKLDNDAACDQAIEEGWWF